MSALPLRKIKQINKCDEVYEHHKVAASGGGVAKNARLEIERKMGRKVISPLNAFDTGALDIESSDMLPPPKE